MKKISLIAGGILFVSILIITGILVFIKAPGKKQISATPTPKPKLTIPANQIPVSERPYVMLSPTSGREVVLTLEGLRKKADSLEYELQYSAGDKEEAAIGSIDFAPGKTEYIKTILLGSKSGGGKITYHENVTGGSLVMSFYNENYKLSNEWTYTDNKKPQKVFTSRDGKFEVTTEKLLNAYPYVIVYQNPGMPENVEKTLLAGPYSISTTQILPTGKVKVSMRLSEDKPVDILAWDGKAWKTYTAKVKEKIATAEVDLHSTYIAVEK